MKKHPEYLHQNTHKCYMGLLTYLLLPVVLILISTSAQAASVSLEWDANTEFMLEGYRLYYGFESGSYPFCMDMGKMTMHTVSHLQPGRTYYFAVTAYNPYQESDFSDELAYHATGSATGGDTTSIEDIFHAWRPGEAIKMNLLPDTSVSQAVIQPILDFGSTIEGDASFYAAMIIEGQLHYAETDASGHVVFNYYPKGSMCPSYSYLASFNGRTWTCTAFEDAFAWNPGLPPYLDQLHVVFLFGIWIEPYTSNDFYFSAFQFADE